MESEITSILKQPATPTCEHLKARWARLCEDFARLPLVADPSSRKPGARSPQGVNEAKAGVRDVGALLLLGHDAALADAESYVAEGHTIRTGQLVELDDVDDEEGLAHWARELDRATESGWAPPAPAGFWGSFLRWRTPLGMARLTERRLRIPKLD